ncbi:hypothetical protein J3R82DRAFT_11105 [Butyriboletus roseoflavus]|nr:hypothetical protein J3R82DRAFT_11105 [Butyriboletus roseoflavus]
MMPASHILKCATFFRQASSPSTDLHANSLLTAKPTFNIYTMRLSLAAFFLLSAASCVFAAAVPVAKREALSERGSGSGYGSGGVDY